MPVIILFALLGALFGGLSGLVIGGVIGYAVSRLVPRLLRHGFRVAQSQYLDATFAAMGALCKADSQVTRDEIQAAEALFVQLRLTPEQRESAKASFNRGKAPDFDLDQEMRKLAQLCRGQTLLLRMFLQVQLMAVAADGVLHPAEHDMLLRMARGLGLPEQEVARLEATLRASSAGPSSASKLDDAHQALGVSPSASDAEVKRAYRRLMSENHPDKLAARGLPDSMRQIAEERTREITVAYDLIKESRDGMR